MITILLCISAALAVASMIANHKRLPLAHTVQVAPETIAAWHAYWAPEACQARTLAACDRLYPIAVARCERIKTELEAYHASLFVELNSAPAKREDRTAICHCPILD